MKVLIAYSSRTGNTRRVAEALAKAQGVFNLEPSAEALEPKQ